MRILAVVLSGIAAAAAVAALLIVMQVQDEQKEQEGRLSRISQCLFAMATENRTPGLDASESCVAQFS